MSRDPSDRGRGPGQPGLSRPRTRVSADDASADHRRKLEALFSGGGKASDLAASTPAPQAERVFSSPRRSLGRTPSEYRLRLERLRIAREVDEIKEAADAFLAHHQLPDEPDILLKLLQHPAEKVAREAMGQISALLMQGRMPATVLLEDRLRDLDGRVREESTRSYVQGLQAQLASLKK